MANPSSLAAKELTTSIENLKNSLKKIKDKAIGSVGFFELLSKTGALIANIILKEVVPAELKFNQAYSQYLTQLNSGETMPDNLRAELRDLDRICKEFSEAVANSYYRKKEIPDSVVNNCNEIGVAIAARINELFKAADDKHDYQPPTSPSQI